MFDVIHLLLNGIYQEQYIVMYALEVFNRFFASDALKAYYAWTLYPVKCFEPEQIVFYIILRPEYADTTVNIVHPGYNNEEKCVKKNNAYKTNEQF